MKKRLFIGSGLLLVVFVGVLIISWAHINEKIKSPEFKHQLDVYLSQLFHGKIEWGALHGSLGVRPSVVIEQLKYVSAQKDIEVETKELFISVRILPLFRRELVFSDVRVVNPSIRLRRHADGSGPVFPTFPKNKDHPSHGASFQINTLSVRGGRIRWVDESRNGKPSLSMTADLDVRRDVDGHETYVELSGTLGNNKRKGRVHVAGKMGAETQLQFNAENVPFALVSDFFPAVSCVSGSFSMSGTVSNLEEKPRWNLAGSTNDILWASTGHRLPVSAKWTVSSDATATVTGDWISDRSRVKVAVTIPDPRLKRIQATVQGDQLDLREFSDLLTQTASGPTDSTGAPWTVDAKADINHFVADEWALSWVRARATVAPASVSLSEMSFCLWGGTVTAQGIARRPDPKEPAWEMSMNADLADLDLSGINAPFPKLDIRQGWGKATVDWQWVGPFNPGDPFLFSKFSNWDLRVNVSSADWKGVAIDEASARAVWENTALNVPELTVRANGGSLALTGNVHDLTENGPGTFTVNGKMDNIETKEWMAALSTSTYLVNGRFSGDLDVSGPWRPWNPAQCNGRLSLLGRDGEFRTAPAVLSVFSALKIRSLLRPFEGKKEMGLPFDVLTASATLHDGRIVIERPLLLKNPSFQIAFTGWMDSRFENGKGTILFNFLQGTSNLVKKIPVISSLILNPDGEFIPLVVDVVAENGKANVTPRSVKTLTGPLVDVVKNVFRFPIHIFSSQKRK